MRLFNIDPEDIENKSEVIGLNLHLKALEAEFAWVCYMKDIYNMMFKRHLVEVGKIWLKYQHVFEELDNEIKEEVKVADLTIEERTKMKDLYKRLCKKYHPDHDPDHIEAFKEINECYEKKDLDRIIR